MAQAHNKLNISAELSLPLSAVTSTLVVYGGKGMGKTNAGAVLVEEMTFAGLKWAVLDPMGVWWGIRHDENGRGKGIECLILGGAHGDIPIEPTGGAVVADLVADEEVNVVIDISRKANGEMWSIAERIRFATDYGKQLFKRQGSLINGQRRGPLMQVIDEAARFIPQIIRAGQPELAMCTSTWSTIVEEGRNVGLGVTLLTQRSARLNKDVAELADAMLAFRTIGPNSLEAVTDWLSAQVSKKELQAMAEQVRSLPVGNCLIVSPGWLKEERVIAIRRRATFDSSATPKPGQQPKKVKGPGAKPDLAKYSAMMAATIERAKQDDPKALKKRITELEREAAKKVTPVAVPKAAPAPPREITQKEKDAIARPFIQERRVIGRELMTLHGQVAKLAATMQQLASSIETAANRVTADLPAGELPAPEPVKVYAVPIVPAKPKEPRPIPTEGGQGKPLSKPARAILNVLGQHRTANRNKVAAITSYSVTSGSFRNAISELRTQSLITGKNPLEVTELGLEAIGDFDPLPTGPELFQMWQGRVSKPAREILACIERGPQTREQIGEATGYSVSSGSFRNALSELRTLELIQRSDPIQLHPDFAEAIA